MAPAEYFIAIDEASDKITAPSSDAATKMLAAKDFFTSVHEIFSNGYDVELKKIIAEKANEQATERYRGWGEILDVSINLLRSVDGAYAKVIPIITSTCSLLGIKETASESEKKLFRKALSMTIRQDQQLSKLLLVIQRLVVPSHFKAVLQILREDNVKTCLFEEQTAILE